MTASTDSTPAGLANPWLGFSPRRDFKYPERNREYDFNWLCCIGFQSKRQLSEMQKMRYICIPGKTFEMERSPVSEGSGCCYCYVIFKFPEKVSRKRAFIKSCKAFHRLGLIPRNYGFSYLASVYDIGLVKSSDMWNT